MRILNAIGTQLDVVWNFGQDTWDDIVPQTLLKLIEYWETEYSLPHDISKTLEERRNVLIQKIRSHAPVNPKKLEELLTAIPGIVARVEENTGKNRFTVWITYDVNNTTEVKKIIERSKPAHLSYDLKFEQLAKSNKYIGFVEMVGKTITVRQVN